MQQQDEAVKATNDDASSCKKSAVDRGYWTDPYLRYFVKSAERKAPEINRGYFARVEGVHTLLNRFLEITKCQCQIVNLGAGFDTTFWKLTDKGQVPINFIDVDFQDVTSRKCHYVKIRRQLLEKLGTPDEVQFTKFDLHSPKYHIISVDLRNLKELDEKLKECKVDNALPTLFMTECVLIYMEGNSSSALLSWISKTFNSAFFINYEQINMGDKFGEVMIQNLKTRNCLLPGVVHCQSLQTQKDRFLTTGWMNAEALNMNDVYGGLKKSEIARIEQLEFLDEKEMLTQLFDHYCICWSYNDPHNIGLEAVTLNPPSQNEGT